MNPLIHPKTTTTKGGVWLVFQSVLAIAGMGKMTQERCQRSMAGSWGKHWSPRSWMALDECEDMEGQRYRGVELRLNFNALGRCNGITPDGGENSFCTIWTLGMSTYKPCLWKAQFTSATHWDFYLKGFSTSSSLFYLLDHLETYRFGWQRRPLTGVERTNKPSL